MYKFYEHFCMSVGCGPPLPFYVFDDGAYSAIQKIVKGCLCPMGAIVVDKTCVLSRCHLVF